MKKSKGKIATSPSGLLALTGPSAMTIGRGKPLEELVKGSMQDTLSQMRQDFDKQFPSSPEWNIGVTYYVADSFAGYIVVEATGPDSQLDAGEYYKVTYTEAKGEFTFAAQDQWETVQLSYVPAPQVAAVGESIRSLPLVGQGLAVRAGSPPAAGARRKGKRFEEQIGFALLEETAGEGRRVRAREVIVADVVNGNDRRYPAHVVRAAVEEVRGHLNETAGQGRAVQILGEAEHPSDKPTRRSNLLETVVKWDEISFDGRSVSLGGNLLATSKGKDLLALMDGGIQPGVSLRGYGESKSVKEDGRSVDEVTEAHFTGFDLVLEPSFENAEAMLESKQGDDEMYEELLKLLKEHPEVFPAGVTEAQIKKMGEDQMKALEETIREALGIDAKANIAETMKAMKEKAEKYDAAERKSGTDAAITEATKDLPYGKEMNEQFVEALEAANPQDAVAVKSLVEAKRKEYDALASRLKLSGMGKGKTTMKVTGPVLENETGIPEFARPAFELTESLRKMANRPRVDLSEAETASQVFAARLIERFDKLHQHELIDEARQFSEAETTSDLNLPYSVSRAIIEEAFPDLIAANIFEVGILSNSPERLYYETTVGDPSGSYSDSVAYPEEAAVVATLQDTWYPLEHGRITPGTVVVQNVAENVEYDEGVDFVIDYAQGRIKTMGATLTAPSTVHVEYDYLAIREGEMAPIQRVKTTLAFKVVEAAADRLADQISREAVVFSRSQLGWDATARTMANLAKQMRRKVDQGMLWMALSSVLSLGATNSAGTWTGGTAQDDYAELVRLIGAAKVIVGKRFYPATSIVCSIANAENLSNWLGFSRTGFENAILNAAGYAGNVKGLPIFAGTEFPDTHIIVCNRQLVQHMVFQPMIFRGPFPTYDSNGLLIAADQFYAEEFNVTESLVPQKGAYIAVSEGS